jgi:hypothetical protein
MFLAFFQFSVFVLVHEPVTIGEYRTYNSQSVYKIPISDSFILPLKLEIVFEEREFPVKSDLFTKCEKTPTGKMIRTQPHEFGSCMVGLFLL